MGSEAGERITWDELDLAEMEAEAFLLGLWNNFEELESQISLDELNVILKAGREKEMRHNKFLAAINGIDMDDQSDAAKRKFEEVQARVEARRKGVSQEELLLTDMGIDIITE